jgi:hypothetical protein
VTIATEKSDEANACISARNAKATNANCASAAGFASCIHGRMPRAAPTIGSEAWASAITNARTRA